MLMKTIGKPLEKLPANAVRALKVSRVNAYTRLNSPDLGVFTVSASVDPFRNLHAMSWGGGIRRETVELFKGRKFAWVGIVTDAETGKRWDNFAEVY